MLDTRHFCMLIFLDLSCTYSRFQSGGGEYIVRIYPFEKLARTGRDGQIYDGGHKNTPKKNTSNLLSGQAVVIWQRIFKSAWINENI